MDIDEDQALSDAEKTGLADELEGPRVTEIPLVGDYFPLRMPRLDRVNMKDVLWFSPHPPPIESADIPADPDEDRPSVAPMAMPVVRYPRESAEPTRAAKIATSLNPVLSLGVVGALIAAAYFVQPQRHGSPIAELALAFPDRVVIDMTEPPPPLAVEDLPVADEAETPEAPTPKAKVQPGSRDGSPAVRSGIQTGTTTLSGSNQAAHPPRRDLAHEQSGPTSPPPNLPPVEPPAEATTSALPPFNSGEALTAIHAAAGSAQHCVPASGPTSARVSVTFAASGRVTQATIVSGPLSGTKEGGCVARVLRSARMEPYAGPPVTVHRTLRLR